MQVSKRTVRIFFSAPYWELAGGIPNDPFDPRTQVRQDITKPFDPDDGLEALKYGQLIKKEIYEGNTLLERREYEYNYYRDPMKFNGPEVIIGRPYKTRACNLEEYGAYPQEIYQDFTWAITAGASRLKRERITMAIKEHRHVIIFIVHKIQETCLIVQWRQPCGLQQGT